MPMAIAAKTQPAIVTQVSPFICCPCVAIFQKPSRFTDDNASHIRALGQKPKQNPGQQSQLAGVVVHKKMGTYMDRLLTRCPYQVFFTSGSTTRPRWDLYLLRFGWYCPPDSPTSGIHCARSNRLAYADAIQCPIINSLATRCFDNDVSYQVLDNALDT